VAGAAASLAALAVYPVKACRASALANVGVGPHGLAGDREWMVVRPDGRFLTQRSHPQLARVAPSFTANGLELQAAGQPALRVTRPTRGAAPGVDVEVWGDRLAADDAGEEAAAWLTRIVGTPARLVRVRDDHGRRAAREWVGERDVPVAFADGFPVLVCFSASLEALNARLAEPVPMDRFRPNVVIAGLAPFAEDALRVVQVGAVELELVKPCTRCSVPGIDQRSGEAANDPFPALRAFRWDAALRGVTFGVNALIRAPSGARLAVGADVSVR
jgi:uncharacterized protein YcbX